MKVSRIIQIVFILTFSGTCTANDLLEVNLKGLTERGMLMRVLTNGRPIWITYRTKAAINFIESKNIEYDKSKDPQYSNNIYRSINKDIFVVFGGCPDAKELPSFYPDKGFICSESGAIFDLAGRPLNNVTNNQPMAIPKHGYKNKTTLVINTKQDGK